MRPSQNRRQVKYFCISQIIEGIEEKESIFSAPPLDRGSLSILLHQQLGHLFRIPGTEKHAAEGLGLGQPGDFGESFDVRSRLVRRCEHQEKEIARLAVQGLKVDTLGSNSQGEGDGFYRIGLGMRNGNSVLQTGTALASLASRAS